MPRKRSSPFKKRVCAVFILKPDGSILSQHRDDKPGLPHPGRWTIPGGHRDPDESDEDCARREVLEESRYRCGDLKLVGEMLHDDGDGLVYDLVLFWTHYDGSPFECLEGQALKFITRKEAERLPFLEFLFPFWDKALREMKGRK